MPAISREIAQVDFRHLEKFETSNIFWVIDQAWRGVQRRQERNAASCDFAEQTFNASARFSKFIVIIAR
jgi:hypothetical protein